MPDSTPSNDSPPSSLQDRRNFLDEQRNYRLLQLYRAVVALTAVIVIVCLGLIVAAFRIHHHRRGRELRTSKAVSARAEVLSNGSWRFIVSGDSRNCGDVVMPAIAAHSS